MANSVSSNTKKADASKKPATPKSNDTGALELVNYRNQFYRDNYRVLSLVVLILVLIIGGLVGFIYYQHKSMPTPKYFATTVDGKIIRLTPLNEPNLTANALLQWSVQAATAAYTFNFVNFREALQDTRKYFTEKGYRNFINALRDANNLQAVRDKKLVVSAVPQGPAVVTQEGVMTTGRYAWQVQMPLLISYQSASEEFKQSVVLNMLIVRVPTLESEGGVGIESFVVREGG